MTGLEKIISQIQEEADRLAADIHNEAQKQADEIISEAETECNAMKAEAEARYLKQKENHDGRVQSSAEQQKRTAFLKAKQEIIAEVIEEAHEVLQSEDTEGYFRTMEKILKTYALAEDGEIYFCEKDLKRMPADFENKISAIARENGGSLVLKHEPKLIDNGFILVYGGIEENCTLQALFDSKKDQLQDRVHEILFD